MSPKRRMSVAIPIWKLRAVLASETQLGAEKVFVNGKALDLPVPPRGDKLVQIVVEATRKIGGEIRIECIDGSVLTLKRTSWKVVSLTSLAELPS
jgi:hypothetical protein